MCQSFITMMLGCDSPMTRFPAEVLQIGPSVTMLSLMTQVNMFTNQGTVIHFNNPKVQASLAANTFTITGHAETKQLTEMLPSILNQLGADSLTSLRRLAESLPKQSECGWRLWIFPLIFCWDCVSGDRLFWMSRIDLLRSGALWQNGKLMCCTGTSYWTQGMNESTLICVK